MSFIDCHVHVLPEGFEAEVPPSVTGEFTDVRRIVEQTGADRLLLAPWVKLLGAPALNEAMAALASEHAVLGSASSAAELRDVMTGPFAGVEVSASEPLGDARFADFWATAEETGALVFVHPSTRGFAGPDEHYLWNTVGNPLQTTVTAAHMVTAGVLERHPDLRVLLAHGGGAVTFLRGRLRHASQHLAAASKVDVEASLRRFYYDTVTHDPAVLRALVDFAGHERVLAGSDHPFDMADPDPAETVRASGVSLTAAAAILGGNAEVLLGMNTQIVVAGAGHNSLITAAYLALAGYSVVVLDARAIPGGGAASEELLGPGYVIDSCSTGHTLIQTNPLLLDDELGLLSRYGLEYIEPDPFAHVAFPDGTQLTGWLDRDRTVEEMSRFSKRDAAAYARALDSYDAVKHIFSAAQFTPIGFGPSLDQRLAEHPIWQRRRAMSAWDVIRHEFEDPHIQAFMLWQAYQTLVPVESDGSGQLAYSIVFGRQRRSWTIPRGGSGALTDALVAGIEEHGGVVLCGRRVVRLLVSGGRCTGVETEDGERFTASQAVVSTIHVKHLLEMADGWDEGFRYGVETFDIGVSAMASYMAASAPPVFKTPDGPRSAVSAGLAGFPGDVIEYGRALRDGRYVQDPAWLLVATPTLVDPSRAPEGRHTVKFLCAQSYGFPERKEAQADRQLERLRQVAHFDFDTRLVKAPEDIEAANEHMIRGTFHGGNRTYPQSGALRPAPGWASHRMPLEGLYQTGGTTHPGGSITGAPGRNAAMVLLQDLGLDLGEVVRNGGRARAVGH